MKYFLDVYFYGNQGVFEHQTYLIIGGTCTKWIDVAAFNKEKPTKCGRLVLNICLLQSIWLNKANYGCVSQIVAREWPGESLYQDRGRSGATQEKFSSALPSRQWYRLPRTAARSPGPKLPFYQPMAHSAVAFGQGPSAAWQVIAGLVFTHAYGSAAFFWPACFTKTSRWRCDLDPG